MRRACLLLVSGLLGCSERWVILSPELPDDIAYVGVFIPERPNEPGSGLYPISAGLSEIGLDGFEDANLARIVGFTETQLARYAPPAATELQTKGLLGRESGYAAMHSSFSAGGSFEDGVTFEPDAQPSLVSAEWRPACLDVALDGEKIADIPCLEEACAARVTQSDCTLHFDGPGCQLSDDGSGTPDGAFSFPVGSGFDRCVGENSGPTTTLSCAGSRQSRAMCSVRFIEPVQESPRFETSNVEIDLGVARNSLTPDGNYLLGLVRHDSTLVVVHGNGAVFDDRGCVESARFVFVDQSTMTVLREAPAPGCPRAIAIDPSRGEVLLVHSATVSAISRFDLEGRALETVELPEEVQFPNWYALEVMLEPSSRALAISFRPAPGVPDISAPGVWRLAVFDVDTLALRGAVLPIPRLTEFMFLGADNKIIVPHGDSSLSILEPRGATLQTGLATGALCGSAGRFYGGMYDRDHSRYLFTSRTATNHGITQLDTDGSACITAVVLESVRRPWGFTSWPSDPNLLVVGVDGMLASPANPDAALAFFDRTKRRFLVGETSVGLGTIKGLQSDGENGVVMYLPGEAKLVRVQPTR